MTHLNCSFFEKTEDNYRIHMLTSGKSTFLTNAYLIESENAVVAIDALMLKSEARKLRAKLDALVKPLKAVFITHGHPDHYNGVGTLLEGLSDVPVIATQGVKDSVAKVNDAKELKWKSIFAEDWPIQKVLPNTLLSDQASTKIDNIRYFIKELGEAESDSDYCLIVGEKEPVVFAGDVIFNRMHSFMNDGHILKWISVLEKMPEELAGINQIYTGHGEPGDLKELVNQQLIYLNRFKNLVIELAEGHTSLSADQKQQLEVAMCEIFPEHQLSVFIQAGADAVASNVLAGL